MPVKTLDYFRAGHDLAPHDNSLGQGGGVGSTHATLPSGFALKPRILYQVTILLFGPILSLTSSILKDWIINKGSKINRGEKLRHKISSLTLDTRQNINLSQLCRHH